MIIIFVMIVVTIIIEQHQASLLNSLQRVVIIAIIVIVKIKTHASRVRLPISPERVRLVERYRPKSPTDLI